MDKELQRKVDTAHREVAALPAYVKGTGGKMFAALLDVIDTLAHRVGQLEQARTTEEIKR